jgi:S-DNA-T family DNA segregation ATPase FtsK/SpoIIIE
LSTQKKSTAQTKKSAPAKKTGSAGAHAQSAAQKRGPEAANKRSPEAGEQTPLLSPRLRSELIGVILAVVAIAVFIAVVAPGNAILARAISSALRLTLGMGAWVLPFLLLLGAASFFVQRDMTNSTIRFASGLGLILLGVLSIAATATPEATGDPSVLFAPEALMAHGGYIGAGLAWCLIELVGGIIAVVIFVGMILAGAVLIGFSITGLVARIRGRFARGPQAGGERASGSAYVQGDPKALANGEDGGGAGGRQGRRGDEMIAPTAQLAGRHGATTQELPVDFSEGDQGRAPLERTMLGARRRALASGTLGESDEVDSAVTHEDDTVLLSGGKAGRKPTGGTSSTRNASGVRGDGQAAARILSGDSRPFELPEMKLLRVSRSKSSTKAGATELRETAAELQATLDEFGVDGRVMDWVAGPTVTLFKIALGEGVRLSKVTNLSDDIALALAAPAVRVFAPIPGTTLVGIEVPNASRSKVLLGDVLPSAPEGPLQLAVGKDVEGAAIVADLEKMPHLLIGGTTGSGKSVAINAMIMSILMRARPEEVRMILIDPKMVELSLYNDIPQLYVPVVTDAQKASAALAWGVIEMERRLKVFKEAGVKNVAQYNDWVHLQRTQALEQAERDGEELAGEPLEDLLESLPEHLPLIVIVIDELADLMMVAGKEVEISISRIAQLARAAGLHLIIATQRPSTNVITGLIKANIVNRIAFNVASGIDSRVILDTPGAEDLIGLGDLLFSRPELGRPQRIQGCLVSEPEIEAVVAQLCAQGAPEYHEDIFATAVGGISTIQMGSGEGGNDDPLTWEAADIIVSSQFGSTSALQRRLSVGYARAGRIMDILEQKGIVGPANGSKPREVLVSDVLELESLKAIEAADSDVGW